jgi:hypothetical protein
MTIASLLLSRKAHTGGCNPFTRPPVISETPINHPAMISGSFTICATARVVPLLAISAMAALAQTGAAPARTLGPKLAEGSETLSQIRGFRELSDGRVIVTDQIEKKIVLLDFAKNTATRLGKQGPGPGEYQSATDLFGMPGDTTLLVDGGRGLNAMTIIAPDGKLGGRAELPAGLTLSYGAVAPGSGHVYHTEMRVPPSATGNDSTPVYRIDVRRRTMDTAFFLRIIPTPRGMPRNPYNPRHQFAVGSDGRVAVVDVEEYRVTWILPNGQRKTGTPIPYEKLPITQRDKDEFRKLAGRYQGIGVSGIVGPNGELPEGSFPAVKPPYFGNGAILIAPNHEVWARRTQRAGDLRPLHDILGADGQRVATISLPENSKLLALGKFGVYLARYDEDDLIHVERYAYPR